MLPREEGKRAEVTGGWAGAGQEYDANFVLALWSVRAFQADLEQETQSGEGTTVWDHQSPWIPFTTEQVPCGEGTVFSFISQFL